MNQISQQWRALRDRPTPPPLSWPGVVWILAIAAVFFYLSNPLSMVPFFGDSLHRAILVTVGAVVLTLPWLRLPAVPWPILPVVGLMYASLAWTISWDVTWGVSLIYVKLTLIAMTCACFVGARTVAYGMTLGGAMIVATSVYAYLEGLPFADVLPGTDGYLAGVGTNRNILAYTLIIGWAFALAAPPQRRWLRALWVLALAIMGAGLFLAQSGTGFVAAVLLAGMAGFVHFLGAVSVAHRRRVLVVLTIAGFLVLAMGAFGLPLLGDALGRDVGTLSGRVDLWSAIWRACEDQLWLGQGWGTTWPHAWVQAPPNPRFAAITAEVGDVFSHGHNSLVDVLPDLGVLGVGSFGLLHGYLMIAAVRRWRPDSADSTLRLRITLLTVTALALFGTTEPLATTPLGWFSLTTLACLIRTPNGRSLGSTTRTGARRAATERGRESDHHRLHHASTERFRTIRP